MKDFSHFVSCPFPQKYPKTSLNQHFQTMFLKLTSALLKTRSILFTGLARPFTRIRKVTLYAYKLSNYGILQMHITNFIFEKKTFAKHFP